MKTMLRALAGAALLFGSGQAMAATELTIATVNNGDMIRMQKLTDDFTKANPDITLQLGHAGGERSPPEGDDRHRHQGRPVRRPHHRHL